jgi:hypothetical protein
MNTPHPFDLLIGLEVSTTQIYTHVMQKPGLGVRSPLDGSQNTQFAGPIWLGGVVSM